MTPNFFRGAFEGGERLRDETEMAHEQLKAQILQKAQHLPEADLALFINCYHQAVMSGTEESPDTLLDLAICLHRSHQGSA